MPCVCVRSLSHFVLDQHIAKLNRNRMWLIVVITMMTTVQIITPYHNRVIDNYNLSRSVIIWFASESAHFVFIRFVQIRV